MGLTAGQLLIVRKVIELPNGDTVIDTGIRQVDLDFAAQQAGLSNSDPSRVLVIPIGNTGPHRSVTVVSEPVVDATTGTVKVTFTSIYAGTLTLNVLFIDPATFIGPAVVTAYDGTPTTGAAIAGDLLWSRRRIALPLGDTDVDTFIKQTSLALPVTDPQMEATSTVGSRIHMIPLYPLDDWYNFIIQTSEPFLDATTGTMHVILSTSDATTVNVLFLDFHTILGPGGADLYNPDDGPIFG